MKDRLKEIEARERKASKRPWGLTKCFGDWNFPYVFFIERPECTDPSEELSIKGGVIECFGTPRNGIITGRTAADAMFIVHAHRDIPFLCRLVRRLQRELKKAKEA